MKCKNCELLVPELFELAGSINCETCWHDYWQMNEIGESESWEDFKQFTLKKAKVSGTDKTETLEEEK